MTNEANIMGNGKLSELLTLSTWAWKDENYEKHTELETKIDKEHKKFPNLTSIVSGEAKNAMVKLQLSSPTLCLDRDSSTS